MARLNKKILCFVDEYGTAGEPNFSLGCLVIWARECGKVDKAFSDLLPPSINEVHAVKLEKSMLQSLLARFAQTDAPESLLMINRKIDLVMHQRAELYAQALIDTVKAGIGRFAKIHRIQQIGNVEVIVDANELDLHHSFSSTILKAQSHDGRFKAVKRVTPLDSAASRVLQLADIVAHSRAWVDKAEENAKGLKEAYRIDLI